VPATHLAPCSTAASIGLGSPLLPRLLVTFSALLAIMFLWRTLRVRIAIWLLFPWICFAFAYIGLPRVEPEPQHPVAGTATVYEVLTITALGNMEPQQSLPLQHPYQMVLLQFVPPGMDTPVKAVDKVDLGSAPNLKEGQAVNIIYDAAHPRIARLQQGTRLFPGRTLKTVMLCCIAYILVLAIVGGIGSFFRLIRRKALP
jgi:hypothetical protein